MTDHNEDLWRTFHDNHAHEYMSQWYVQHWKEEIDFIVDELNLNPGDRVLDVGCGAGRHSVELARRGCQVTGIDISTGMLDEARKAAATIDVEVDWRHCDATQFSPDHEYDGAICMLEAAFALVNAGVDAAEHDLSILRNISKSLKSGAGFILEAPNALNSVRGKTQEDIDEGRFDPITMVAHCPCSWKTPDGEPKELVTRIRSYFPSEIPLLFEQADLEMENIWGSSRRRSPVRIEGPTFTVVARKR